MSGRRQQTAFAGDAVKLELGTGTEFSHHAGPMDIDGFLANAQLGSHLFGRAPGGKQQKDFAFAGRQPVDDTILSGESR